MPDIDIALFCYEQQQVIDYVISKYGKIMLHRLLHLEQWRPRAAIKDVGRALAMPYADVNRISKMIPTELGCTIEKALKMNMDLKKVYDTEKDTRYLIDMSLVGRFAKTFFHTCGSIAGGPRL